MIILCSNCFDIVCSNTEARRPYRRYSISTRPLTSKNYILNMNFVGKHIKRSNKDNKIYVRLDLLFDLLDSSTGTLHLHIRFLKFNFGLEYTLSMRKRSC